jgi:hypothetical protein
MLVFVMTLKTQTFCLLTIATLIIFGSCDSSNHSSSSENQDPSNNRTGSVVQYPYKYISNKREIRQNDESYNEMTLYVCGNHLSIDTLKMFCKSKRDSISDGVFHIITFFDDEKYAKFTKYPITSMFGVDKLPARHIKADYTFNRDNGYSKLTVYEKNSWDSKAQEFDVN